MDDWSSVLVFGKRPEVGACAIRPSAYGIIEDGQGRLAVVHTPQGTFLPGGGIDAGETPEEAIKREILEECGLIVRLGLWTRRAVQFAYLVSARTHFEKRSLFIEGVVEGSGASGSEADHELVWVEPATTVRILSHQSHCWAVEQWRSCDIRR